MNKKISDVISSVVLLVTVVILGFIIYTQIDKIGPDSFKDQVFVQTPVTVDVVNKNNININTSLDYLFDNGVNDPKYSNIVGYFAQGAFAFYIPEWLVKNWNLKDVPESEDMYFTPKELVAKNTVSDITITVRNSTETLNAETLFENEKKNSLVISEILLSKHTDGGIKIIMEDSTRIYHIQKEVNERVYDSYYIDGNNKTVMVQFSSDKENFSKYSTKIRDFVEGIGELKAIQG